MLAESLPDPIYQQDGVTLYHGDCAAILPWFAVESVDHLITDPPYTPHVHASGRRGDAECVAVERDLGFASLTDELRRLTAREAGRLVRRWVVVFCPLESTQPWKMTLENNGLEYIRTGIWVKDGAAPQFTGDRPANGAEALAIAHHPGQKKWNGGGRVGIWWTPIVRGGRLHPAQKPLRLMRQLIEEFTDPGDLILDPFAGSGTTLRAALDLRRAAIGIEQDAAHCQNAVNRLRQRILPWEEE